MNLVAADMAKLEKLMTNLPLLADDDPIFIMRAHCIAGELAAQGYVGISNKYMRIARIDREDWLEVLAADQKCSIAELYVYGTGSVSAVWQNYYRQQLTLDKVELNCRAVYSAMPKGMDGHTVGYLPK